MDAFVHTDIINYSPVSKKLTRNNVPIDIIEFVTSVTSALGGFASVDIDGGNIDGVSIGLYSPATLIRTLQSIISNDTPAVYISSDTNKYGESSVYEYVTGTAIKRIFISPLPTALNYFNVFKMVFGKTTITSPTARWEFSGGVNIIGAMACQALTCTTIGSTSITCTGLSAGSGTINGGAITGSSLSAGSGAINGGAITGTSLSTGSGTINGGAITGTSLSAGSGNISTTGTISGGTVSAGAGGLVTSGAVSGAAISSGSYITGASLSVGSGAIDGGAITGTSLSAGSGAITGGSLSTGTGNISGGDISGEDITGSSTISAPQCICGSLTLDTDVVETVIKLTPTTGVKFIAKVTTTSWAGKTIKKIDLSGYLTGAATGSFDLASLGVTSGYFIEVNLVGKLLPLGQWGALRFSLSANPGIATYRSMYFFSDPATLTPYYIYNTASSDPFVIGLGTSGSKSIIYNASTPDRILINGTIIAFQHN